MEKLVPIQFDLWSSLISFGIFQGILLLLILAGYKRSASSNFLIGMIFVLILNLFNQLVISTRLYLAYPHLLYLFTPTLFLLGPIYYAYVRSVIQRNFAPPKIFYHSLPFIFAVILMSPFMFQSGQAKIDSMMDYQRMGIIPMSASTFILIATQIIQVVIYIVNANSVLKRMEINGSSRNNNKRIRWLQNFGLVFIIYWGIDFIALAVYTFIGAIHPEIFYVTSLCSAMFINYLVYYAIKNNKDFNQVLLNLQEDKYRHSTLSKSESAELLKRISIHMEQDKPYLNQELSLNELAQSLGVSSNQVSQVLNMEIGKSFYEFINKYRYTEAKHRLKQPEFSHLTILAIAYDAGFNNKNTFNKVFKKHSGYTPSQYVRLNKAN